MIGTMLTFRRSLVTMTVLLPLCLSADSFGAQRKVQARSSQTARRVKTAAPSRTSPRPAAHSNSSSNTALARARKFAQNGQYQEASRLLFQMSRSPQFAGDSAQIKYILGLTLFEMKLNQAAAFVFYDVVRQESRENPRSRYIRQSLEKLAIAADALDSDVLLRYAVKQVKEDEFPAASRDMLYYRTAELKMQEKQFADAVREFARVRSSSFLFSRARYNMALALAEAGELEKAQAAFEDLAERTADKGVTNPTHVNALLGRARILYQRQQFSSAIEAYRDIPRDTEQWHDALFESSWAMLRDGRFRSALSNFHSLHSPYYEDVYQPESLLLRAIVYLYICRYDEMDKVLNLFERIYKPVQRDIGNMLSGVDEPLVYYKELERIEGQYEEVKGKRKRTGFQIPFVVARQVLKEADVRRTFSYLSNLDKERKRLESLPVSWKSSSVGLYAKKIIEKRAESTRILAGKQIRRHLILIQNELRDLFEQNGFLRFEMISGKKESLRKEIQGKGLPRTQVDEQTARSFYIQNGFEYWPFQGEYWLDEIGNYHYVGVKACE